MTDDWIERADEIEANTDFSRRKCEIIALLESDQYPEQRQIADVLGVSASAISDHKKRLQKTIEDVEYLKSTSDYF